MIKVHAIKCLLQQLSLVIVTYLFVSCECASIEKFVNHNHAFSRKMYRELSKSNENSFIFSPFSIQVTGSLLHSGAKEHSKTSELIQNGFELVSNSSANNTAIFLEVLKSTKNKNNLKIANGIFLSTDSRVSSKFIKVSKKGYTAAVKNLNFHDGENSTKAVNKWIDHNTNGRIKDLFGANDIDPETRMLLVNAIYFKGQWKEKFNSAYTKKETFFSNSNTTTMTEMMSGTKKFSLGVDSDRDIMIGEFRFEKTDIFLQIIIPTRNDLALQFIEDILLNYGLNNITDGVKMEKVVGDVEIPKFIQKFEINLKETLSNMGLESLFSEEADFSGFLKTEQHLSISNAIHKSIFEVNEDGAEAASVTGFSLNDRTLDSNTKSFIANQSFIYLLKGKKNEIYFIGRFTG